MLQQDSHIIGGALPHQGMHHVEAWAAARSLDIQDDDVVLDPMCGRGTLLAEAAVWWPRAKYIGCDLNGTQLELCRENFKAMSHQVTLHQVDAAALGGIPLTPGSVSKALVAPPWNRQFPVPGKLEDFYARMFMELSRLIRADGRIVVFASERILPRVREAAVRSSWGITAERRFRLTRATTGVILVLEAGGPDVSYALPWEGAAPKDGRELYEHWRKLRAQGFPQLQLACRPRTRISWPWPAFAAVLACVVYVAVRRRCS